MSDTYTKLFRSITASTIVSEPVATRWLWVTMLSQADASGCVWGSVPGLARLANITLEECGAALACFHSPDPYSRTQDHDGRRVESIPRGWRLLNHAVYAAIRSAEERADYKREWDRGHRPSGHARAKDSPTAVRQSDSSPTKSDSPTPPALTPTLRARAKATGQQAALSDAFDAFWSAYPVKKGRAAARKAWAKARPPPDLLTRLDAQKTFDDEWLRGFAPRASTYLNGERWNDEIAKPKPNGSRHETRPQRLQRELESIHHARRAEAAERHDDARALDLDVGVLRPALVNGVR